MKCLLLLLCIFLITHRISSLTEKQFNATKKLVRNTCQNKSKATSEAIDAMRKGNFNQDKNAQCYIHCILNTYNLLNKELIFDWEGGVRTLKENAPESIADPGAVSIQNCKDAVKTRSDKCIAATEVAKCLHDDNPTILYFYSIFLY
uniref:Odorant binding protein 4 n=1 Tax=Callosobruchus chinensis TaxID=146774 RepID=A0A7D6LM57_CALCS|nr:odorant binding protein 4 [Callosobruchus chinensis]